MLPGVEGNCGRSCNEQAVLTKIICAQRPPDEAVTLAGRLLAEFGNLNRVLHSSPEAQRRVAGMSAEIDAEFKRTIAIVTAVTRAELCREPVLDAARKVADYCRTLLGDRETELLYCIYLNRDYRLLGERLLQEGTVNHVTVYPREILRHALLAQASRIVLIHNNPSGSTRPSRSDKAMTAELSVISQRLGIDIADHVILAGARFFSFRENGMLDEGQTVSIQDTSPFASCSTIAWRDEKRV